MVGVGIRPLAIALLTGIAFLPTLQNDFVNWDDRATLVDNLHYRGLGWEQLRWMLTTTLMGHWMPLTWATFGLDYLLWGMRPVGYHLTSLLLHAANAVAFYFLALRLLRPTVTGLRELTLRLGATTAALFFAIRPLRVESVAWATGRRDVLAGLFFLLTLLTYLKAAEADGPAGTRWLRTSVGLYALAVLSKAIVMTLPLLLILLDVYPLRRISGRVQEWAAPRARKLWAENVPYALLALVAAGMAIYAQTSRASPLDIHPLPARVQIALYGLGFYLWKTLIPVGLSPLYELPARMNALDPRFLGSSLGALILTGALVWARRKWPAGLGLWVSYAVLLAPVSGLTQSGPQFTADRYSYLACLGWGLRGSAPRPTWARFAVGAAAAWLFSLGALTWNQVHVWRDTETLWAYAISVDPNSSIAHNNLGYALLTKGKLAVSRPRVSLDTSLGGMMVLQGGSHGQAQERQEGRGGRGGGRER